MTQPDPQGARALAERLVAEVDHYRPDSPSLVFGFERIIASDRRERDERVAALEGALRLHNQTPTGKVRTCLPGCIACALLRPSENSYLIDQDFDE